jgi:hypothetical protein
MANLYGPQFVLTTADRILQEGDSISALDTNTQVPNLVKRRWQAKMDATVGGPRGFWANTAVSATGVATALGRVTAGVIKYAPTKFIALFGTADWILGTSVGVFTTNFNSILDAVCGNGIPAYIMGTVCVGEKWPTGQNPQDATFGDPYVAAMIAGAARYPTLCTFRDLRNSVYAVQEPLLNLPAPGTSQGPLTRPDGVFAHFNPTGAGQCDQVINQDIALVDYVPYVAYPNGNAVRPSSMASMGIDIDGNAILNTDGNPGISDASNVTIWWNRGRLDQNSWNLTVTPGTKPVYRQVLAAGKINGLPGVQAVGTTFMQSTAQAAALRQPILSCLVWKQSNVTATQILVDGSPSTTLNMPVLITTGALQPAATTAFNPNPLPVVAAGSINCWIQYWDGTRSYSVLNGSKSAIGNTGTFGRDRLYIFASSSGGILPASVLFARFCEWHSDLGALPRWEDVYGEMTGKYGQFPQ